MKKLYSKISIVAAAVLMGLTLYSCSSDNEPTTPPTVPAGEDTPISFNGLTGVVSRVSGLPLEDYFTAFNVKTLKWVDGTKSIVMGSATDPSATYAVNFDNTMGWYYNGIGSQTLKYWDPKASRYTFSAYAPTDAAGITVDDDGVISISGIEGNTATLTDLVVALGERTVSGGDIADRDLYANNAISTPANLFEPVALIFHHLLPTVEFRLMTGFEPFTVTHFSIKGSSPFVTKADYDTTTDSWSSTATTQTLANRDISLNVTATQRPDSHLLYSATEIPQTVGTSDKLTVTVTVNGGEYSVDIDSTYLDWQSEKAYIYYLVLNPGEPSLILAYVTVETWRQGEKTDSGQTNW